MARSPFHQAQVAATPWPDIHATCIHSALHYGRHSHDTHGVGVVEQGAQLSASGRGSVRAYAGNLITTNPGEMHDGKPLEGPARRWRMLYFEPQVLARWLWPDTAAGASSPTAAATPQLTLPVIADPALLQQFCVLLRALDHWAAGPVATRVMACDEALAQTLHQLATRHCTQAPPAATTGPASAHPTAAIRAAHDRLADEAQHPPDLATLAANCGLSRYQFLRRFKAVYGLPPHAWLLQQRAEKARHLIRHGTGLAAAAGDCGFADQSHLHRHFVRQFGYTPGAWRQAMGHAARG